MNRLISHLSTTKIGIVPIYLFVAAMATGLCSCTYRADLVENRYMIDGIDTSDPATYPPPCGGDTFLMPLDPNEPSDSAFILLVPLAYEMNQDKLLEGLSSETSILLLRQLAERNTTLNDFYKKFGGWCDCAMSFSYHSTILKEVDPWDAAGIDGTVQIALCDDEDKANTFDLLVAREGDRCYIVSDDPYELLVKLSASVRKCLRCYDPCTYEEFEPAIEPVDAPE